MTPMGTETKIFTSETLLEWLYQLNEEYFPDAPSFELLKRFVRKEICLTAYIDFELGEFVDLEDSCHNYHSLPYAGGLFDQPIYLMQAFNVIRGEKNKYEKTKADKLLSDLRSSGGSGGSKTVQVHPKQQTR
jgi:hypothetical protein